MQVHVITEIRLELTHVFTVDLLSFYEEKFGPLCCVRARSVSRFVALVDCPNHVIPNFAFVVSMFLIKQTYFLCYNFVKLTVKKKVYEYCSGNY